MDPKHFDALARSLARAGSRRRLLGGLLVGTFTPLAAAAKLHHGPEPASCLAIGKRCTAHDASSNQHVNGKGKGKRRAPSCTKCCSRLGSAGSDGKARCACKPEGDACANPSECCGGLCRNGTCTACPGDLKPCNGACVDLQTNNRYCGDCATTCASGQRCQNASCVCDGRSCLNGCCDGATCQRGTSDQACGDGGAACQTCGACTVCDGTTCAAQSAVCCGAASVCQNGQCVACGQGQRCKGGACVCDGQSCAGGCCDGDDRCHNGTEDGACGAVAGACVDCGAGGRCVNRSCCPLKSCSVDYPGQCGSFDDGCGGTINCGCPACQKCDQGECVTNIDQEGASCGTGKTCVSGDCVPGICTGDCAHYSDPNGYCYYLACFDSCCWIRFGGTPTEAECIARDRCSDGGACYMWATESCRPA